jgi:hypothetical protein
MYNFSYSYLFNIDFFPVQQLHQIQHIILASDLFARITLIETNTSLY